MIHGIEKKMTKEQAETELGFARNMFKGIWEFEENTNLTCVLQNWDRAYICDDGDCRSCAIAHAYAMGRMVEVHHGGPRDGIAYSVNVIDEEGPH